MTLSLRLRRAAAAPLWLAAGGAALAAVPLLRLAAHVPGDERRRATALVLARLIPLYVLGELALVSRLRAAEISEVYRLLGRFLDRIVAVATATMDVEVELVAEPAATEALAARARPLVVLSRHAGAGDSLLLVHLLLCRFGRRPFVVMKELLALDPLAGLAARRIPMALIGAAGKDPCDEVERLAGAAPADGAVLLFPEGGNVTRERRRRAVEWLRRHREWRRARRAERLEHLMAPRAGGVLAALDGAPGADVVFCAHHGLGSGAVGLSILRDLPFGSTVCLRLWHVAAEEIPATDVERVAWLDDWWARLDAWVDAREDAGAGR